MTEIARKILDDCKSALTRLKGDPESEDWKLLWVANIVLLRAVGHALHKTDGGKDMGLKKIIEKWWEVQNKSKPEPKIFWCFIVDERNSILKEYKFGAGININVHVNFNAAQLEPGKPKELLSDRPTEYDYVMNKGPFKGIDQRDLITQAVEWWEQQLSGIEEKYNHGNA